MPALFAGRVPHRGYRHEAALYRGEAEFLELTVPFVRGGLDLGQPVIVGLREQRNHVLRTALGAAAERVEFADVSRLGGNPARITPVLRDFAARHAGAGALRAVGEPISAGRRPAEVAECQIYESLLNLAFGPGVPLWMLCLYERTALAESVLDEALRAHPMIIEPGSCRGSAAYGGADHAARLFARPLPAPAEPVRRLVVDPTVGHHLADWVRRWAEASGVPRHRASILATAIRSIAETAGAAGRAGLVQLWQDADDLVCQVQDPVAVADPMIGRRPLGQDNSLGRALRAANDVCDLVQVRSNTDGTTVRVHTWL